MLQVFVISDFRELFETFRRRKRESRTQQETLKKELPKRAWQRLKQQKLVGWLWCSEVVVVVVGVGVGK